jgi:hypothetical protein
MRHVAVLALALLAACPADDSYTPDTLLTEMSASQLRGICDEEVERRASDLGRAADAYDCLVSATSNEDPRTCQAEVFDPCVAALPATSDRPVSCYISDRRIEWLQYCQETTAQQYRDCLAQVIELNIQLTEARCVDLGGLGDRFENACPGTIARCSALDFEFLLAE